ncbi:hypothetical protein C2G38_2173652 [Gigaspora rosea]|uniref:Uncharacterized protein n=1 Tax=Gigaspora rosea TaxID=44941 RepID=A0A397VJB5_9GLOM|nr:hypothetical protein C2G38_2173652 [Gigaspora rosea]
MKENDQSRLDLTKSLEMEPNNQEYNEVLWDLTKSLEIEPNNAFALSYPLRYRGMILYMMEEYDKSLLDLTKPLEIDSDSLSYCDAIMNDLTKEKMYS